MTTPLPSRPSTTASTGLFRRGPPRVEDVEAGGGAPRPGPDADSPERLAAMEAQTGSFAIPVTNAGFRGRLVLWLREPWAYEVHGARVGVRAADRAHLRAGIAHRVRPAAAPGRARRVPVHPRRARVHVRRAPGRCASTPASAPPRSPTAATATCSQQGTDRPLAWRSTCPPRWATTRTHPLARGEVGRVGRGHRLDRGHARCCFDGIPLDRGVHVDDDQRARRRSCFALYIAVARSRACARDQLARDDPERHP